MWAYYDAMLYLANWGTRRLLLRFPRLDVDAETLAEYAVEDMIGIRSRDEALLLDCQVLLPAARLLHNGFGR